MNSTYKKDPKNIKLANVVCSKTKYKRENLGKILKKKRVLSLLAINLTGRFPYCLYWLDWVVKIVDLKLYVEVLAVTSHMVKFNSVEETVSDDNAGCWLTMRLVTLRFEGRETKMNTDGVGRWERAQPSLNSFNSQTPLKCQTSDKSKLLYNLYLKWMRKNQVN